MSARAQRPTGQSREDDDREVVERLRAALEREARVNLHADPLQFQLDDGVLTMTGDLADIAAKKRALRCVEGDPAVEAVVDHLHVAAAEPMGEGELRDRVSRALLAEPALGPCAVAVREGGEARVLRHAADEVGGCIDLTTREGVVFIDGEVPSLTHRRLAGVLAWWVPGTRDVVNRLAVQPPEQDNDDEITDALQIVLEKDPFVNAGRVAARAHGAVVTLTGLVPSEAEREMAEFDAWYVLGVEDVDNRIEVGQIGP